MINGDYPFYSTFVYGEPHRTRKQDVWHSISQLNPGSQVAWLCIGDYNCVSQALEKMGGRTLGKPIEDFNEFIQANTLMDLGFKGDIFTWTNRQQGVTNI